MWLYVQTCMDSAHPFLFNEIFGLGERNEEKTGDLELVVLI